MRDSRQLSESSTMLKNAIANRSSASVREMTAMHPLEQREYSFLCSESQAAVRRLVDGLRGTVTPANIDDARCLTRARDNLAAIPSYVNDEWQRRLRAEFYSTIRKGEPEAMREIICAEPCDISMLTEYR